MTNKVRVTKFELFDRCWEDGTKCFDCAYFVHVHTPCEFWGEVGTQETSECDADVDECPHLEDYIVDDEVCD